jgi:dienelactone hydrolase
MRIAAALILACALGCSSTGAPRNDPLHEEVVTLPGPAGRTLVATWYRPAGPGPFPLIVLSHGSPPDAAGRARMGRYRIRAPIGALVERGFAVLVPMRRGFGATDGAFAEGNGGCAHPDYVHAGTVAAEDILAALRYARSQPFVRSDRVLFVGQSVGGMASVAAASARPAGLVGVVNFSGGNGGDPDRHPGEPCHAERLRAAYAVWGAQVGVPVLWHYVDNDKFFSPRHAREWFAAFERAGGRGELVIQPPYGLDGHGLFTQADAVPIWTPAFDRFVAQLPLR